MVEEFKKSYKNGYEVMLKPKERDQLVEYINELEQETNRLKELWKIDKQNWSCIMYEKEKEIGRLNNIINELEKYLVERIECNQGGELQDYLENTFSMIYSVLQELKGSDK